MWPRTLAGFFLGLLVAVSLMLNLNFLLPVPVDVKLLIGLISGFILWAGAMLYCYYSRSVGRASLNCLMVLVISGSVNAAFMLGPL